ncbi:hypothetical protein [Aneurinibacillus thermoaerophilus]|jgi:cbb3-type cytochrome oxidase subunit 3|uniref:hypothetical protein n=1 Tax=Aneurinibacillus thermoaerophilus TaxID=143495 RepID=UPI002E224899|nr:hypothetical protein [Aneurinibacillus thermoaerophilus]MED0738634.1 hypothetical protein [Aneurinibacillus thermoaerophilus]MED0763224.1 hypothetical protein [Aneurinibacillus thermoaerophilus]
MFQAVILIVLVAALFYFYNSYKKAKANKDAALLELEAAKENLEEMKKRRGRK